MASSAVPVVELRQKSNSLENITAARPFKRPQSIACDPSRSRPIYVEGGGGSKDNGINLIGYRHRLRVDSVAKNTRWHSDTNIASNPHQMESKLSVNKTALDINEDGEGVAIHWDIKENVSAKDWIGLYKTSMLILSPSLFRKSLTILIFYSFDSFRILLIPTHERCNKSYKRPINTKPLC